MRIHNLAAMAYILAVNPMILSSTGMDTQAVIMATAVAAAIGCFLMAFMTNYPIALAPGMGTNAYFAFVAGRIRPHWQAALSLVFWNGLFFYYCRFLAFEKTSLRRSSRATGRHSSRNWFLYCPTRTQSCRYRRS